MGRLSGHLRHFPHLLSVLRASLAVPLILSRAGCAPASWLAVLLVLAAVTDLLDGPLARRLGVTSGAGGYLDAGADCLVVLAAFASFVREGLYPPWLLALIGAVFAQFVLTSGRAGPRYDPVGRYYGAVLFAAAILTCALPDFAVSGTVLVALVALSAITLGYRAAFLLLAIRRG